MPERQRTKKHDSKEVQGAGSYVIIRAITVKGAKLLQKQAAQPVIPDDASAADWLRIESEHAELVAQLTNEFMADSIMEWNWVDDEGKPLAQPKDDPTVLDELTPEEIGFLSDHMGGMGAKDDNGKKKRN